MRIIGIELGSWSVKAVEVDVRFRKAEIVHFHEERLPIAAEPSPEDVKAAVSRVLGKIDGHIDKLVLSLSPIATATRFLRLPVKQRKKVEQMYRFELEDSVPFKLDDALIEHHVMREAEGSLVFAVIAQRAQVETQLERLRALGLDPDCLTFDGMGVINCYFSRPPKEEEEEEAAEPEGAYALVDLGHKKTTVSIWIENHLVFFRGIPWGGHAITDAIALGRGLSPEEAEGLKMRSVDLAPSSEAEDVAAAELNLAAAQSLSPLIVDLNHCLMSFRSQSGTPVAAVGITGGTSRLRGVAKLLSRALDVPVDGFDPTEGQPRKSSAENVDNRRFGEALGRALVFARKGGLLFNFRKDTFGKGTSITEITEFLKNPVVLSAVKYVGILVAILFVHVNVAGYLASKEVKSSREELRRVFSEAFREVPPRLRDTLTAKPSELRLFLEKKDREVDAKLKAADLPRKYLSPTVAAISSAFPPTVRVDINRLELSQGKALIEGVLYEGDLKGVSEKLGTIPDLKNVQLKQDGQRFRFEGDWQG
jgi:Tfp pilus assembly PilM family ATPase